MVGVVADELSRLQAALAERYAIGREIGRGGMARVYLARGDYEAAAREYALLTTLDPAAAQALAPAFFSVW